MPSKVPTRRLQIERMPSRELHAICGTFDRRRQSADLTYRQEWLYDVAVRALEERHRAESRLMARCWCRYCVSPFDPSDAAGGAE